VRGSLGEDQGLFTRGGGGIKKGTRTNEGGANIVPNERKIVLQKYSYMEFALDDLNGKVAYW